MIPLQFDKKAKHALQILCLGCHSDDIEIGCGGSIIRLAREYPDSVFHWVVFSAIDLRKAKAQRAATQFVDPSRLNGPILKEFPDGFMPFVGAEIKYFFEELKQAVKPNVIFTHNRNDAHQDHRIISDLTWNTFRDHLILEYEIPKYDGDIGRPSVFVRLTTDVCETKIRLITDAFPSQSEKRWFQADIFDRL